MICVTNLFIDGRDYMAEKYTFLRRQVEELRKKKDCIRTNVYENDIMVLSVIEENCDYQRVIAFNEVNVELGGLTFNLFVDFEYRNMGVATKLINETKKYLQDIFYDDPNDMEEVAIYLPNIASIERKGIKRYDILGTFQYEYIEKNRLKNTKLKAIKISDSAKLVTTMKNIYKGNWNDLMEKEIRDCDSPLYNIFSSMLFVVDDKECAHGMISYLIEQEDSHEEKYCVANILDIVISDNETLPDSIIQAAISYFSSKVRKIETILFYSSINAFVKRKEALEGIGFKQVRDFRVLAYE